MLFLRVRRASRESALCRTRFASLGSALLSVSVLQCLICFKERNKIYKSVCQPTVLKNHLKTPV